MKKLIKFIKTKEQENNISAAEKKVIPKAKKIITPTKLENEGARTNDLFWDGYSDIGYC